MFPYIEFLISQGIFQPENNAIVLIQNFWLTVTSSIGYLFLIPFYVVRAKKSLLSFSSVHYFIEARS